VEGWFEVFASVKGTDETTKEALILSPFIEEIWKKSDAD